MAITRLELETNRGGIEFLQMITGMGTFLVRILAISPTTPDPPMPKITTFVNSFPSLNCMNEFFWAFCDDRACVIWSGKSITLRSSSWQSWSIEIAVTKHVSKRIKINDYGRFHVFFYILGCISGMRLFYLLELSSLLSSICNAFKRSYKPFITPYGIHVRSGCSYKAHRTILLNSLIIGYRR